MALGILLYKIDNSFRYNNPNLPKIIPTTQDRISKNYYKGTLYWHLRSKQWNQY